MCAPSVCHMDASGTLMGACVPRALFSSLREGAPVSMGAGAQKGLDRSRCTCGIYLDARHGPCFLSRTLHDQFYSWYYPTSAMLTLVFRLASLAEDGGVAQYRVCLPYTSPRAVMSSILLQLTNVFLLTTFLYLNQTSHSFVPYLDADARTNLLHVYYGRSAAMAGVGLENG
ncbi:hypothetical protein PsorP6_000682 [Peronosclerospora sorghi]|uniref:Uncharacterized protein n=1 Tax=Peronosclerospora sorghi TaxID=230839 RepID=A0ACC0WYD1_9STRA|nr:hypothetical protein PsorP6_000682 [Peronosclerospora sorghi]